jgi:RNA polymerase sigma factor (sigma-70 family)
VTGGDSLRIERKGATGDPHAVPPRTVSLRPENNLLVHAEQHVRLARNIVRRTRHRPTDDDDGIALLALVDAAAKWNAGKRPCKWSTFAANRVRWELLYRFQLASADSIAAEVPLFTTAENSEDELHEPACLAVEDPELVRAEARADVEKLLATLTPKEADVIRRRFGIGTEPATFDEIGEDLGVGRERVRQIEKKALATLRKRAARHRVTSHVEKSAPEPGRRPTFQTGEASPAPSPRYATARSEGKET